MNIFTPPKGIASLLPVLRDAESDTPSLGVDGSMLEEIMRCPRASYFKHVLKRAKTQQVPELLFGGAMHCGYEVMNLGLGIEEQEAVIEEHYEHHPLPEDDYRHLGRAKEVLHAFHEEWSDSQWQERTLIEAEKPFSIVLGTISGVLERPVTIIWEGRTDRTDRDKLGVWPWDLKTAKDFGPKSWDAYLGPSSSMLGYCWAKWRELGEMPRGFVMDLMIVRKPAERVSSRTLPRNQFERRSFPVSPEAIKRWEHNTMATLEGWLRYAAQGFWPQFDRKGFNCSWCQYREVCQQGDENSAQTLLMDTADFEDYVWSPLNERE